MSAKRRDKWGELNRRIRELEEVYGITVEMGFTPLPALDGQERSRLVIRAFWADETDSTTPMAVHTQEVRRAPQEAFLANMNNALTVFTYQCVEAYIQALPPEPVLPQPPR